jgi:hypothetical protein
LGDFSSLIFLAPCRQRSTDSYVARCGRKQPGTNLINVKKDEAANTNKRDCPSALLVPNPAQTWPTRFIEKSIEQSFGIHQFGCRWIIPICIRDLVHACNQTKPGTKELPRRFSGAVR